MRPAGLSAARSGNIAAWCLRFSRCSSPTTVSPRCEPRLVVFDVPILAGVDLRSLSWQERRDRVELLARAFDIPLELSPVIAPTRALAIDMADGRLGGSSSRIGPRLPRRHTGRLAQGQGPLVDSARGVAIRQAIDLDDAPTTRSNRRAARGAEEGTMKANTTIVAVTGHERPRRALLERVASLGRDTGATVILFDRDADLGPLMSPLPTDWSADGEEEQFPNRLNPRDLEAAGQAGLAEQVERLRAAGVQAFGWLPPKADAKSLAEYASDQAADTVLVSAEDDDFIDGLRSLSEPPNQLEVVSG
jgi:hypothetical protein